MFTLKSMMCATLFLALSLPAYAASCSFDAYIEDDDLYSSKGVKLSTIGQIIRQDRANVYAAAAGTGDSPDYCGFDKAHNREALQKIIDKSKISNAPKIASNVVMSMLPLISLTVVSPKSVLMTNPPKASVKLAFCYFGISFYKH